MRVSEGLFLIGPFPSGPTTSIGPATPVLWFTTKIGTAEPWGEDGYHKLQWRRGPDMRRLVDVVSLLRQSHPLVTKDVAGHQGFVGNQEVLLFIGGVAGHQG